MKKFYIWINLLMIIIGIGASLALGLFVENEEFKLIWLLPISYMICFNVYLFKSFINNKVKIFRMVFITVGFLRYIVAPICMMLTKDYSNVSAVYIPSAIQIKDAIFLMCYEIFIYTAFLFVIDISNKKNNARISDVKITSNRLMYYLFIALTGALIIMNPVALSYFTFIIPKNNELTTAATLSGGNIMIQIAIMCSIVSKSLIFIMMISWCKNKYDKSDKKQYVFLAIVVTLINACIYYGISMSQFLFNLIASMTIFFLLFPQYKKIAIITISIMGIIILFVMNVARNRYDFYENEEGIQKLLLTTQTKIEGYFGGINNVAIGLETANQYSENRNIENLLFDFIRPIVGVNILVKDMDLLYSNVYFNYTYFQDDMTAVIFPTITQGYFYFGYMFSPLLGILLIYISVRLEQAIIRTRKLEYIFFFSISLMRLGTLMGANINLQINDLSMQILVPIILIYLNDKIVYRRRELSE